MKIVLPLKKAAGNLLVCLLMGVPCLVYAFSAPAPYTRTRDGVIIQLDPLQARGTRLLELQVLSGKVIHIKASPGDAFGTAPSLMADPGRQPVAVNWTLREEGRFLLLQTPDITARVSLQTGTLQFSDKKGNLLLSERNGNGRSFSAVTIDGRQSYQVCQAFDSPPDEALYGMGENQNGFMNLKGQQVDLTQQNSVAVVPFLVSNRHYGLLWDNYSVSRFGDCREFQPLSVFTLYDATGKEGSLTATYASRTHPDQVFRQRPEQSVGYEYLDDLAHLPAQYELAKGLITWQGELSSATTGVHKLLCKSAGYIKIWFNGQLVTDKWRQAWNPGTTPVELTMEAGKRYPVRIEWIPDGEESYLSLKGLLPVPGEDRNSYSFYSEAGDQVDYYFVYGKDADEVIAGYRYITGKAQVMPKWAMGLWQSRERYRSQQEILQTVQEFRKRRIPLDNIVMDWQYWRPDQWGSHEFDTSRFPDAAGMIDTLHRTYHTQFMISVWPKFYTGTHNYQLFNDKGWLYKKNVENQQKDWLGYVSTFYDAFNPEARQLFWQLMDKHLYQKGVDAWWLDATEPDIYSNISITQRKALMTPTALGSSTVYFNAFPVENAKAVYEGQRSSRPNERVFILTRSAYAGLQRYAASVWSGDIAARWHDMRDQVAAGVNFSLSGIPYWSMDIGGFAVERRYEKAKGEDLEEWREQTTRWYQFGAFCPLFRVHGQFPYREIYHIAPETHPAYQSMLYYDELRYRLMPYIYTLAGMTWHNDYTIMRGLHMDFADDKAAANIKDQYMLGPSLLVCPVTTYKARSREVYLPAGTGWYNLYTGALQKGAQTITADAIYERMPVFVKQGSILPAGPRLQYAMEKQADTTTLFVYTGADGSFSLYEDEGTNYNYEKGAYSRIAFTWNEKSKTLEIGNRQGAFDGMLQQRVFRIKWITPGKPAAFDADAAADDILTYTGTRQLKKMK